jgi:NAD(P)-dependent dehydrogenase (short-subunit alcohol dehydrogenase family)
MRAADDRRVAVITGGSSGIGLATALVFARQGWRVGLIARSEAGLRAAEAQLIELGARVCPAVADVGDAAALEAAATRIAGELGRIGVWINAAGNGVFGTVWQVSEAEYDRVTATTYTGTVNGVRTALRQMGTQRPGVIVNVCSAVAFRGLPGLSCYAGAKAAVRGFTECVQIELKLARSPVRLAIVYPPAVNTPFFAHAVSYLRLPPRPARPVYQPEVVAEGVYLAATRRLDRLSISSITVLFDLTCRLAPWLVTRAMLKLGYEGQMTDLPAAACARDPCLFAPPMLVTGTRGPFEGRETSSQLWVKRHVAALLAGMGGLGRLAAGWRGQALGRLPDAGDQGGVERPPVG